MTDEDFPRIFGEGFPETTLHPLVNKGARRSYTSSMSWMITLKIDIQQRRKTS